MNDKQKKEIVSSITPETFFLIVIALFLGTLILTGLMYQ